MTIELEDPSDKFANQFLSKVQIPGNAEYNLLRHNASWDTRPHLTHMASILYILTLRQVNLTFPRGNGTC
jgi:hypothetical protein